MATVAHYDLQSIETGDKYIPDDWGANRWTDTLGKLSRQFDPPLWEWAGAALPRWL